jgi:hypothetical protein
MDGSVPRVSAVIRMAESDRIARRAAAARAHAGTMMRLLRYASHIQAAWTRLYPVTCARFEGEGRLDRLALAAATAAFGELTTSRAEGRSLAICHSAAAEVWAMHRRRGGS